MRSPGGVVDRDIDLGKLDQASPIGVHLVQLAAHSFLIGLRLIGRVLEDDLLPVRGELPRLCNPRVRLSQSARQYLREP